MPPEANGGTPRRLRIVLALDSGKQVARLRQELTGGGFDPSIERVRTVEALKAAVERSAPDLVIADCNLEGFRCLQALEVLQGAGQDVPFIVLSARIGQHHAIALMRAGAHDFLIEEDFNRLVPVVERELREASHRRERRRAEEALRASECRYRELFENANDAVFTVELDGRFTSFNRAGEAVTGYRREEALNLRLPDLAAPDTATAVRSRLAAAGPDAEPATFEVVLIGRDGRRIPLEIAWRPIVRGDRVVEFEGIARDLTERKRLEDQLRQAQKMEAVGRLAGGIAHDFNNLLMAVTGYSELLLERMTPNDPQHRSVDEIRKAASRAAALTRQLLMFSRKHVLEPVVLDVNGVVDDLERMLRRLIGEDIELTTSLTPDTAVVKADRGQVEQILMNLAVNARDAMPHGGRLRIATRQVSVTAGDAHSYPGVAPGDYVALEVQDTGCGMDAATLSHAFEPFFTTKEPGKGTGLGLSTVYGIVTQAGGAVLADSAPGKGTIFRVLWPRSIEATRKQPDRKRLGSLPRGTEHVLLVEDEVGVRELIRDFLIRCGYSVTEAAGAHEAVALFARNGHPPIDVLITDVVMPQMNGRVLAERLLASQPALKVLYISGYTDDAAVGERVTDGAGFLQKPFTPDALARKVREILDTV
jgi:two-component system cell cycle sensor histidine kinase/response regulator CckA